MQTDIIPRNERERISRKGWQTRDRRLIKLGEIEEHRAGQEYGEPIIHVARPAPL